MVMTAEEKRRELYMAAQGAIDYIWNCADKGIVPMKHDANLMAAELERIRSAEVAR